MIEFIFNVTTNSSYNEGNKSSQKNIILISLAIFIFISLLSKWQYGISISVFIFIIQFFKSNRWEKYFIQHIELINGQVRINYFKKNKEKEITENQKDFKIKKQVAFNRSRTVYLAIYKNNDLLIKQFEIGEWNEKSFDKVIEAFA